jgi:hypothetical protein
MPPSLGLKQMGDMHGGVSEPQVGEWRANTTLSRLANRNSELEF